MAIRVTRTTIVDVQARRDGRPCNTTLIHSYQPDVAPGSTLLSSTAVTANDDVHHICIWQEPDGVAVFAHVAWRWVLPVLTLGLLIVAAGWVAVHGGTP